MAGLDQWQQFSQGSPNYFGGQSGPQQQPGSYGYVNQTTGAQTPNYTMTNTGSIIQNFPGYAKGGRVRHMAGGGGILDTALRLGGGLALPEAASQGYLGIAPQMLMQQLNKPKLSAQDSARAAAMPQGLASAAQQLQSYGRAPDTMLAHVSPSEAQFIDYIQGGRRANPMTGLPEYGMFGDILKYVARAAGAIGGFMVGGPLGAAAGAGIATKLTGGSWKDALTSAALSGVGGELGQGMSGGGWNVLGSGEGAAVSSAASPGLQAFTQAGQQASLLGGGMTAAVPSQALAQMAGSVAAPSFAATAMSTPGIAAGLGAISGAQQSPQPNGQTTLPPPSSMNLNIVPQPRTYNPYQGDPLKFATPGSGGQGFQFYTPLNPVPQYVQPQALAPAYDDRRDYARGGRVRGYALGGPAVTAGPSLTMPNPVGPQGPRMLGAIVQDVPAGGVQGLGAHADMMRQATMMGFQGIPLHMAHGGHVGMPHLGARMALPSPAAHMGAIHGPGTGTSDSIPAALSDGEHVFSAQDVANFGAGSNNAGHKVLDNIKQNMRRKAGFKNTSKATNGASVSNAMIGRAQRRAGIA